MTVTMRSWVALSALALGACAAETYSPAVVDHFEVASGDLQQGILGAPLDSVLQVRLLDTDGRPMTDVPVEWTVVSGGGSLDAHTSVTGPDGMTYATGTLGYGPEPQIFRITATGVEPLRIVVETSFSEFTTIAVGNSFACGLDIDSLPWCWGEGRDGKLGADSITWSRHPRLVGDGTLHFADLALGDAFACGRTATGEVWCWGANYFGMLGNGQMPESKATPARPLGLPPLVFIDASNDGICGLTAVGDLWCWGYVAGEAPRPTPALIFPNAFTTVAVGSIHVCGIRPDSSVACWGRNEDGQLGQGTVTGTSATLLPLAVPITATAIDASVYGTCAIASGGALYCWGYMEGMRGHSWNDPARGMPTYALEYSPARKVSLGYVCGAVWQSASSPKLLCPQGWTRDIEALSSITELRFGWYTLCLQAVGGVTLCKNYGDMIDPAPFAIRGVAITPPAP